MTEKPIKKIKCAMCKKRINMLLIEMHKCKCNNFYCSQHLLEHDCNFNHFQANKDNLENTLLKVEKSKINNI